MNNYIQLEGLNKKQRAFADILWGMNTQEEVERFMLTLPIDDRNQCQTVLELIILAYMDEVDDTHDADMVIADIMSKWCYNNTLNTTERRLWNTISNLWQKQSHRGLRLRIVSKLEFFARPLVAFDPANKQHRAWYYQFLKENGWGHCPVRFICPNDVGFDLTMMIRELLVDYYVNKEFAQTTKQKVDTKPKRRYNKASPTKRTKLK